MRLANAPSTIARATRSPGRAQVALGRIDAAQGDAVVSRIEIVSRNGAAEAVRDAEVVFEALPEVLDAKADALRWLGEHVDARATIASTTSTFVVTELQRHVAHPERMLNAHWLNPALLMPLVEISRSDATGQSVVDALAALLERVGKKPVICGPAPGYIVPRIQALAMNEAARMVEEVSQALRISTRPSVRVSARASRCSGCSNSSTGAAATSCTTRRRIWQARSVRASRRPRASCAIWKPGVMACARGRLPRLCGRGRARAHAAAARRIRAAARSSGIGAGVRRRAARPRE